MLFRIVTTVVLVAVVGRADGAQLISSFHLDLDDCDDIAADSNYLYFACHSAHAPGLAPASPPNTDAWVAKLERRTGKLLYLTQLGGEGTDVALRVKIDRRGDAYVTGLTGSRNFPVTPNAVQRSYGGGPSDAFFAEIGSAGQILYCTYLGGPDGDEGNGIAFSRDGSVFIGGRTWSADFPGAKRRFGKGGKSDLFVARLKSGEPAIRGALILGGAGEEKLTGIAYTGNAIYATGYTESSDFPMAQALQKRLRGPSDAFLLSIEDDLETLKFSTFLGGSGDDSGWGIALDRKGNPIVAGITESDDMPLTANAAQKHRAGNADAFLMKLSESGQKILFSTYYGGTGLDHSGYDGQNIVVTNTGTLWMVGLTNSRDLMTPGGYHPQYGGGEQDGFVVAFLTSGKQCYGTYTGGSARYLLEGITFADRERTIYAVGTVIRPIEKDSPPPNPNEKYGMFVIGLRVGRGCR